MPRSKLPEFKLHKAKSQKAKSPEGKSPPWQKSKHRTLQATTTPLAFNRITQNITQTSGSINISFILVPNDGVLVFTTNGNNITTGVNGMFDITTTCSGNSTIFFPFSSIPPFNSGNAGGYVPRRTVTNTPNGPIYCPRLCNLCLICTTNRGRPCCGTRSRL